MHLTSQRRPEFIAMDGKETRSAKSGGAVGNTVKFGRVGQRRDPHPCAAMARFK